MLWWCTVITVYCMLWWCIVSGRAVYCVVGRCDACCDGVLCVMAVQYMLWAVYYVL